MKYEIDQYKEQLDRTKEELEQANYKKAQLTDSNAQINVELGKAKVRIQFMKEKSEKDVLALLERKQSIQVLINDHQIQVNSFNDTINLLRQAEKGLVSKIQNQKIETLRTQDKLDRTTRQLKLVQEKLNAVDGNLKNRHGENSSLLAEKRFLKSSQLIGTIAQELTQSYAERDQQSIKFDKQLKQLNAKIIERDREISQLNQQLQELNFSLNTLKLDSEAQTNQNVKKILK